jgi:hypothetical protein
VAVAVAVAAVMFVIGIFSEAGDFTCFTLR